MFVHETTTLTLYPIHYGLSHRPLALRRHVYHVFFHFYVFCQNRTSARLHYIIPIEAAMKRLYGDLGKMERARERGRGRGRWAWVRKQHLSYKRCICECIARSLSLSSSLPLFLPPSHVCGGGEREERERERETLTCSRPLGTRRK